MPAQFFFAVVKKRNDKKVLGHNTDGGVVMVGPIRFQVCWNLDFTLTLL